MKSPNTKITPAMQQWHDMKHLHPDKLLLFRMGDFYELFHNDAVKASKLLGITLTKRGRDADAEPDPGQQVPPVGLDQVSDQDADHQGGLEALAEADEEVGEHDTLPLARSPYVGSQVSLP